VDGVWLCSAPEMQTQDSALSLYDSTLFQVVGFRRGPRISAQESRVLEAGLQILEVYRNAGLRAFWGSPEILNSPRNWLS
jgi:hypothetical protein